MLQRVVLDVLHSTNGLGRTMALFTLILAGPASALDVDRVDLTGGGTRIAFPTVTVPPTTNFNVRHLSLRDNSGVFLVGCIGETCSGFEGPPGSTNVNFRMRVIDTMLMENSRFFTNTIPANASVDVFFEGVGQLTGNNNTFGGSYSPLIAAQGTVRYENSGNLSQFAGTTTVDRASFFNSGSLGLHNGAEFTVLGNDAGAPPGVTPPRFSLVNASTGVVRALANSSPSFVNVIDNSGTVSAEGRLELGGGAHRDGVFESKGEGSLRFSGSHTLQGDNTFRNRVFLLETLSGRQTIIDVREDSKLTIVGDPGVGGFSEVPNGAVLHLQEATLPTTSNAQLEVADGSFLSVFGDIEGRGRIVNKGHMFIEAGGSVVAQSLLSTSTSFLRVNGTVNTGPTPSDDVRVEGVLSGDGTINGNLVASSTSQVFPGNSPGTLTVNGRFSLEQGAELVLEIERDAQGNIVWDRLVAQETFIDGVVRISVGPGIDPLADDLSGLRFFECVQHGGGDGSCAFSPNASFVVDGFDNALLFASASDGIVIQSLGVPIPEPDTTALLVVGLGVVGWRSLASRRRAPVSKDLPDGGAVREAQA